MQEYRVPVPLVKKLRRFLQDYAEANELVEGEESPDQFLAEMLVDAMNRFNLIEPAGPSMDIESLSAMNGKQTVLVVDEAAARVLTSVSIRMQRNMINITDGNTMKEYNAQWQFYQSSISRLRGGDAGNGFDKMVKELKIHLNCEGAWGEAASELYDGYRYGGTGYITVLA
jgi:hypothetical protein